VSSGFWALSVSLFCAEGYHQNYFNEKRQNPCCALVVNPKVDKFRKVFAIQRK